jgi:hypothetical protein
MLKISHNAGRSLEMPVPWDLREAVGEIFKQILEVNDGKDNFEGLSIFSDLTERRTEL